MLSQGKSKILSGVARSFVTTPVCLATHYEALGLTPKATQGDIKSAYYKLSMMHHPDKCSDAESSTKFRAITEAYEILGNIKLKKMYDKGLMVGSENKTRMDYHPDAEPTDPTLKFYKSHSKRKIVPTMGGRTPIYDFDAWSKNHYGKVFKQSQYEKEFEKIKRQNRINIQNTTKEESYLYVLLTAVSLFLIMMVHNRGDYDIVVTPPKKEVNESKETR